MTKLKQQLEFLTFVDRLKSVERKTSLIDGSRRENSAEHSWQMVLSGFILAEYSSTPIDILKVLKMLALHDVAEVEAGDTFHFHKSASSDADERVAAKRIFDMLPTDQATECLALWTEFEELKTNEAKFARALDRLWPIIQNLHNNGGTWQEFNVSYDRVMDSIEFFKDDVPEVWGYLESVLALAKKQNMFTC